MKKFLIPATFWVLMGVFFVILGEFFIPAVRDFFKGSILFLLPIAIFFLLGIVLIFLTIKGETRKPLRKFLILTGLSSSGFFVSILLHNFIYGLFIYLFGSDFWQRIGLGDEPIFFIIAIIICPIGFLIGIIGSIVMFVKKNNF